MQKLLGTGVNFCKLEVSFPIQQEGNPYNKFYAQHNLLSYYYLSNDKKNFDNIYSDIRIPKLLSSDTTFFLDKFKWLRTNIGSNIDYKMKKRNEDVVSGYNDLYLWGTIERWFE